MRLKTCIMVIYTGVSETTPPLVNWIIVWEFRMILEGNENHAARIMAVIEKTVWNRQASNRPR